MPIKIFKKKVCILVNYEFFFKIFLEFEFQNRIWNIEYDISKEDCHNSHGLSIHQGWKYNKTQKMGKEKLEKFHKAANHIMHC